MGKVDQVIRGRDLKIRRVIVRYQNAKESHTRLTDRAVRKLVKLFSIDEFQVQEDLTELQKRVDQLMEGDMGHVPVIGQDAEAEEDEDEGASDGSQIEDVDVVSDDDMCLGGDEQDGQAGGPASRTRSKDACNCCCPNHCGLSFHTLERDVRSFANIKVAAVACEVLDVNVAYDFPTAQDGQGYMEISEDGDEMFSAAGLLGTLGLVL